MLVWIVIVATPVLIADKEDIEGVLEVVWIAVSTNVVIPLVIIERDVTEDIIDFVRLDLIAVETVAVVRVRVAGCWKVSMCNGADAAIDIEVVTGNGSVGEIIRVVFDTAVLIRRVAEVSEASTIIKVFVVVLILEDIEMVPESAIAVTSFFAVVITVLKIFEAVVDMVTPVGEADRVVEFVV